MYSTALEICYMIATRILKIDSEIAEIIEVKVGTCNTKLFFLLFVIAKCQFLNDGCQLWPQISKLFLNQFSKFLWLSCSKFPGLLKKGQKFLCMCSRTRENDKKQSGTSIVGHPVCKDFVEGPLLFSKLQATHFAQKKLTTENTNFFKSDWTKF